MGIGEQGDAGHDAAVIIVYLGTAEKHGSGSGFWCSRQDGSGVVWSRRGETEVVGCAAASGELFIATGVVHGGGGVGGLGDTPLALRAVQQRLAVPLGLAEGGDGARDGHVKLRVLTVRDAFKVLDGT